jgi:hypothetical protein
MLRCTEAGRYSVGVEHVFVNGQQVIENTVYLN